MTNEQARQLVFAGSYAAAESNGVYVLQFDESSEQLTLLHQYSGLKNPTFLNVDTACNRLYAITEGTNADGGRTGEAVAYAIAPADGSLTQLNREFTVSASTCHIQRDASNEYITVSSYNGGMIGLSALTEDGRIGEQLDVVQHEGHGPNADRQECAHVHSSMFSPDGKYLYVQDLGIDRIRIYTIDREAKKLVLQGETVIHPGGGPRHLAFHPTAPYAYVINELDGTVTAFDYHSDNGALTAIQTISTLPPEGFEGENTCAEITVSKDGRFVYGSNRGHDSLVVYAIDQATGKLTTVQIVSVEGAHPRHFALTPSGNHLLAANRDTNNIAVFRVNRDSGELTYTGNSLTLSQPVCVLPVYY